MTEKRGWTIGYGFLSAILFGASVPLSKILLKGVAPLPLASLLYLGSGAGLLAVLFIRRALGMRRGIASPAGREWFRLSGAVLSGGVLAPLLLMEGLSRTPASNVSLLLNLELVATAALAWLLFKEGFETRAGMGFAAVVAGAAVLAWPSRLDLGGMAGAAAVALACLLWGLDNNLTQGLAHRDPRLIAGIKGFIGGGVNAIISSAAGEDFPSGTVLGLALAVGFACYGMSLALFVISLRKVGTVRTTALFALAPFAGAGLSLVLLKEPAGARFAAGLSILVAGVVLTFTGRHEHLHSHEGLEHDHPHTHDGHHSHAHDGLVLPEGTHGHPHRHDAAAHSHPHFPDTHHRHTHY